MDQLDNYKALQYIVGEKREKLAKCRFNPRILISKVKNNLQALRFLLEFINYDPGAGSSFFTNVKDNATFDLYKEFNIDSCNCFKDCMTEEQWDYLYKIGYIDKDEYNEYQYPTESESSSSGERSE